MKLKTKCSTAHNKLDISKHIEGSYSICDNRMQFQETKKLVDHHEPPWGQQQWWSNQSWTTHFLGKYSLNEAVRDLKSCCEEICPGLKAVKNTSKNSCDSEVKRGMYKVLVSVNFLSQQQTCKMTYSPSSLIKLTRKKLANIVLEYQHKFDNFLGFINAEKLWTIKTVFVEMESGSAISRNINVK